jgi:putative acetyltransferase
MKIRKYKTDDFVSISEIYSLSKLDELQQEKTDFELLPLASDTKRLNQLVESDIYVYDENGVIGYCAIYDSEIRALFVHPDFRNIGIGKKMLEFLLAKINGNITLYVAKSNVTAKTLYSQYGFEVTDEFETSYNGKPVLANKMERIGLHRFHADPEGGGASS